MRYIKLTSSILIGLVGFVFYFFTMPSIDTEDFLTIVVESGDENILDDTYLEGSLDYKNMYYSSFLYQDQDTLITEELPFLQKIDDPYSADIRFLLEKYPEFISDIHYDMNRMVTQYGESEDYVTAAYFNYEQANYSVGLEELHLEMFNKETKKTQKEKIKRTENTGAGSADIYAIHENYPTIQILFSSSEWDQNDYTTTSVLVHGEYNLETKKYSENVVKKLNGDFMYNEVGMNVTNNEEFAILPFYIDAAENDVDVESSENTDFDEVAVDNGDGQDKVMVVNLINGETSELKFGSDYLLSEQNELFSVTEENGSAIFRKYDDKKEEVVDTISLDLEKIELDEDIELVHAMKIVDDRLIIIQNSINHGMNQTEALPALFQAFAIESGDELAKGKITFNTDQASISQAFIDEIGKIK